eukprot:1158099-Pelagomonas_calceolata.AAC.5
MGKVQDAATLEDFSEHLSPKGTKQVLGWMPCLIIFQGKTEKRVHVRANGLMLGKIGRDVYCAMGMNAHASLYALYANTGSSRA